MAKIANSATFIAIFAIDLAAIGSMVLLFVR
jgi:hypothetical protein